MNILIGSYNREGFGGVTRHIAYILGYSKNNFTTFSIERDAPYIIQKIGYGLIHFGVPDVLTPNFLKGKFNKSRFDCLHSHGLQSLFLGKQLQLPVIQTLHGGITLKIISEHFSSCEWGKRRFYQNYYRNFERYIEDVNVIITVSDWISKHLRHYIGVNSVTIPNMLDVDDVKKRASVNIVDLFGLKPKSYIMWIGGRFEPINCKRPQDFIFLADNYPEFTFVMAGKGVNIERIRKLYGRVPNNLVIVDPVEKFGVVKSYDVFLSLLRDSMFSVMTSYYEGFGYTLIESLSLDVPVLAPNTGGPSDIITNDVGILYNQGDYENLLMGFEHMRKKWHRFKELENYVRERFSPEIIVPRIDRIYESVCG